MAAPPTMKRSATTPRRTKRSPRRSIPRDTGQRKDARASKIDVAEQRDHGGHVHVDLDTLATALYVRIDDELKASPQLNPYRPKIGTIPKITDAELITVAVLQALLGHHNENRWIRAARKAIGHLFPYLPKQPGYNK